MQGDIVATGPRREPKQIGAEKGEYEHRMLPQQGNRSLPEVLHNLTGWKESAYSKNLRRRQ